MALGRALAFGRTAEAIRADIRDIAAPRAAADHVERQFGMIDIVSAKDI